MVRNINKQQKKRRRQKIDKIIPFVFSDASLIQGDRYKLGILLKALGFHFKESRVDLYSDIFRNHETGQEVALIGLSKEAREDLYRRWIDSEEEVIPGKNLRYLLAEDFKDWALSRGEWLSLR